MAIKTRPDSGLRTGPKHPTRTIHKNCMIPCCRKLGLEIHAHRHGHACPPAWPPGGQFFAKKIQNGARKWPQKCVHFLATIWGPRTENSTPAKGGPQIEAIFWTPKRARKNDSKLVPNLVQNWCKNGSIADGRTGSRSPLHSTVAFKWKQHLAKCVEGSGRKALPSRRL